MVDLLYKEFVNDICMEAINNQSLKLSSFVLTTKKVMLGKTPSTQYIWKNPEGEKVAEFKIWEWWDGKNVSDLEISKSYRGNELSYQLLDYATKKCGAKNLAVKKTNKIAKHVYDKYGFKVTETDDTYMYMTLK